MKEREPKSVKPVLVGIGRSLKSITTNMEQAEKDLGLKRRKRHVIEIKGTSLDNALPTGKSFGFSNWDTRSTYVPTGDRERAAKRSLN